MEGCGKKCEGFLTDREQRKVWGVGILYVLGLPLLLLMTVVGGMNAVGPGEPNPNCPAEPNMPWMLIVGGAGVGLLLLLRIGIVKCLRCIKNNQVRGNNEYNPSNSSLIRLVATTSLDVFASLGAM